MKYAVIFRARIKALDEEYRQTAAELRALALSEFNCTQFVSAAEGDDELAISYWESLEDIRSWKQNAVHRKAQSLGREKWYESYEVQITRVEKAYEFNN